MSKNLPLEEVSPATQLLEKHRMMYEIQETFEKAKEEERTREKEFKEKEKNLRSKDLVVQERLIAYNQFLQDNDVKRIKALKKYEDEYKQRRNKEERIDQLKQEIQELKEKAVIQEREVTKMRKYEAFLDQVKETFPDEFTDIGEILTRYNTLKSSYDELTERRKKLDEENINMKIRRDELEKRYKDNMLELNIDISHLQKRIDEAEMERYNLQKSVEHEGYLTTDKQLVLGNMLSTINNLFDRCQYELPNIYHESEHRKELGIEKKATVLEIPQKVEVSKAKLKVIKAYILNLQEIISETPKELIVRISKGSARGKELVSRLNSS